MVDLWIWRILSRVVPLRRLLIWVRRWLLVLIAGIVVIRHDRSSTTKSEARFDQNLTKRSKSDPNTQTSVDLTETPLSLTHSLTFRANHTTTLSPFAIDRYSSNPPLLTEPDPTTRDPSLTHPFQSTAILQTHSPTNHTQQQESPNNNKKLESPVKQRVNAATDPLQNDLERGHD